MDPAASISRRSLVFRGFAQRGAFLRIGPGVFLSLLGISFEEISAPRQMVADGRLLDQVRSLSRTKSIRTCQCERRIPADPRCIPLSALGG
jgi:hypothetical protein